VLLLSQQLLHSTLQTLRRCGGSKDECVAYWSGPLSAGGVVDGVLHPRHRASPQHYEVEPSWLNETWLALAREGRTLRAQVHTHTHRAFHSSSDDRFPIVQSAGFLSLVLPDHGRRDDLHGAYLCELTSQGTWRQRGVEDWLVVR
jgi:hypothetical protein